MPIIPVLTNQNKIMYSKKVLREVMGNTHKIPEFMVILETH